MVSDIIKTRLREGKDYKAKVILKNDYAYIGYIGKTDGEFVEMFLDRGGGWKIILLSEIKEVMVYHQKMEGEDS